MGWILIIIAVIVVSGILNVHLQNSVDRRAAEFYAAKEKAEKSEFVKNLEQHL